MFGAENNVPEGRLKVKTKKHKSKSRGSSKDKRSPTEERLYHGACLPDEFLDGTPNGAPPPQIDALRVGPLPSSLRPVDPLLAPPGSSSSKAIGAWGTFGCDAARAAAIEGASGGAASSAHGAVVPPVVLSGVGVAVMDGRKRAVRGGVSEDGFSAVLDVTNAAFSVDTPPISTPASASAGSAADPSATAAGRQQQRVQTSISVGERVFHMLAVFDGHRSNHAARFCAKTVATEVSARLRAPGVVRPMTAVKTSDRAPSSAASDSDSASSSSPSAAAAAASAASAAAYLGGEEAAIADALSRAVVAVDDEFCRHRWVSLVRDNGKKFYITRAEEVDADFNIHQWDTYGLERTWRSALGRMAEQHTAAQYGLNPQQHGHELRQCAAAEQDRWHTYKKELYPGCALCVVLVDEARGKLYCANVGDCAAMLVHIPNAATAAPSTLSLSASASAASIGGGNAKNSPPRVPATAGGLMEGTAAAAAAAAAAAPSPPPPEAMLTEELANANISSPDSDSAAASAASAAAALGKDSTANAQQQQPSAPVPLPLPAPFVAMNRYDGAEDYTAAVAGFDGGNGMYAGGVMFRGHSGGAPSAYHNPSRQLPLLQTVVSDGGFVQIAKLKVAMQQKGPSAVNGQEVESDENAGMANGALAGRGSGNPIINSSSGSRSGHGMMQQQQQEEEEGASAPLATPGVASFTVLSRPHKPQDVGELRRVCATKRGFVEVHGQRVLPGNAAAVAEQVAVAHAMGRKALYRINRDVSLSRAIGDMDLKEFGVVATPEITVYNFGSPNHPSTSGMERWGKGTGSDEAAAAAELLGASSSPSSSAAAAAAASSSSSASEASPPPFFDAARGTTLLVMASDGVWDVIEPDACAEVIADALSHAQAELTASRPTATREQLEQAYATSSKAILSSPYDGRGGLAPTLSNGDRVGSAGSAGDSVSQDEDGQVVAAGSDAAAAGTATGGLFSRAGRAAQAGLAARVAQAVVDAAAAVVKNNDDVTALVATLAVDRSHAPN